MAGILHHAEGWEYANSAEWVDNNPTGVFGNASIQTSGGYLTDGPYIKMQTGSNRFHTPAFPEIGPTFGIGVMVGTKQLGNTNEIFRCQFDSDGEINVQCNASNQFTVRRGATVLDTSTETVTDSGWHKIYFEVTLHNSTGSFSLYLDGVLIASGSGLDTSSSGNLKMNQIRFGNTFLDYDHCIILKSGASVPTDDWLVQRLLPDGAGNYADLTPSAGSNYQNVDDAAFDADATYNESGTPADRDSYAHADVVEAITGTVLGIIVRQWLKNVGPGTRYVKPFFRISAADYDGTVFQPSTDYSQNLVEVFDQNPATVADWTAGEVTTIEAGLKIDS